MVYRVRLEGIITVYSEEALERITKLAEDEELFNYLSTLINTGSETNEVLKKLDLLLSGGGQTLTPAIFPRIPSVEPARENKTRPIKQNTETGAEKVAPLIKGTAMTVLNRMRKVNKK